MRADRECELIRLSSETLTPPYLACQLNLLAQLASCFRAQLNHCNAGFPSLQNCDELRVRESRSPQDIVRSAWNVVVHLCDQRSLRAKPQPARRRARQLHLQTFAAGSG
jgi:hypothetical protein